MPTFKKSHLRSSSDMQTRQKAKPVMFLEGDTDHRIFSEYWFLNQLDKIDFKLPELGTGCVAVCNAVAEARKNSGVPIFGWIDRDKLSDNLDLVLETDDLKFEARQPYPHVKVSLRWELENYLLEPDAVEQILAAIERQGKIRNRGKVVDELLEHANILVPMAAWNLALHRFDRKAESDGRSNGSKDRGSMEKEVIQNLGKMPEVLAEYHAILPRVDEFLGGPDLQPEQKLEGVLRIVNGKAMLLRMKNRMKVKLDLTFLLAKDLRQNVPAEIRAFVDQCIEAGSLEH